MLFVARKSMQPHIDDTAFGSITIAGERIDHDVLIRLDGEVVKRKKKLSKAVYGSSHTVSLAEAEYVFETSAERLIVGSGQYGMVMLSPEATDFLAQQGVAVELLPTPQAVARWNAVQGRVVGLFHVTC